MKTGLINIDKAAEMLGVSQSTLRIWDNNGTFPATKTNGGHRRYHLADIQIYKEKIFIMNKFYHLGIQPGFTYTLDKMPKLDFSIGDTVSVFNIRRLDLLVTYTDEFLIDKIESFVHADVGQYVSDKNLAFTYGRFPVGIFRDKELNYVYNVCASKYKSIDEISDLVSHFRTNLKVAENAKVHTEYGIYESLVLPSVKFPCVKMACIEEPGHRCYNNLFHFAVHIPREKALELWWR